MRYLSAVFLGILLCGSCGSGAILTPDASRCEPLTEAPPEEVGLAPAGLQYIDAAVDEAIKAGEIPGAVVLIGRHGRIAYLKAFGQRAVKPQAEPMTTDTIFDIASLSKVVVTTPAIMQLVDKGFVRLGDPVNRYLPQFKGGGKADITVGQLLTHYSGLRPDFDIDRATWSGYQAALNELWKEKTVTTPGKEFAYSDLNFIALGEIVNVASGQPLDVYVQEHIFVPLGMAETTFLPPVAWKARTAPTETLPGEPEIILRGEVHDPTARRMGGVAGHAGVFSSARDLAIYAQTLLNRGVCGDRRLMSEASFAAMTRPQNPPGASEIRGFGWDIGSKYAAPRGDLFSGGFGHTGFTGTSLWIHPPSDSFVIILSNRLHPGGEKSLSHLRGVIANILAASITDISMAQP